MAKPKTEANDGADDLDDLSNQEVVSTGVGFVSFYFDLASTSPSRGITNDTLRGMLDEIEDARESADTEDDQITIRVREHGPARYSIVNVFSESERERVYEDIDNLGSDRYLTAPVESQSEEETLQCLSEQADPTFKSNA